MVLKTFPRLGPLLILLITVVAVVMGCSTESWQRGVVAILMGLAWLISPPSYSTGRLLNLLVVGLLVSAAFAFLPISWFGMAPWRVALTEDLGLPLANTLSPQPWISLDALLQLALGLLWLLYVLGRRWEDDQRVFFLNLLTFLIGGIALTAIICFKTGTQINFWAPDAKIGPVPNRNHFATLLSVGAVLAAHNIYDHIRRKDFRGAVLFLLCLGACFAAIVLNESRAGAVLLFAGIAAWMGLISIGTGSYGRFAVAASCLLILAAVFFTFGGTVLERLTAGGSISEKIKGDGRTAIYKDCLVLASQSPLCGIGLGNFEGVFSLSQRHYHNLDNRVIHPESDWIWVGLELGLFGLAIACWLLVVIIMRAGKVKAGDRPRRSRRRHRIRMGALVAASIIPFHGLFDVPGHVLGLSFLSILLFSLAASRHSHLTLKKWPEVFYRIIALPVILLGIVMVATHFRNLGIPSNEGAQQLYGWSVTLSKIRGASSAALNTASLASYIKPLEPKYHLQRGLLSARVGRPHRAAREDFRRARFLEQQSTNYLWAEARHWVRYHPPYAITPWREILARDPSRLGELYGRMLKDARKDPTLLEAAKDLTNLYPQLKISVLGRLRGTEFQIELEKLLTRDPELIELDGRGRQRLFQIWAQNGDRARLIELLEKTPAWKKDGWRTLAEHYASLGKFEEVAQLIDSHFTPPVPPEMPAQATLSYLAQEFFVDPTDAIKGLRLFYAQKRARDTEAAIATLEKISQTSNPPDYLDYLRYRVYRDTGEFNLAWEAFQKTR